MANYCMYCGAALPPQATQCPECGRSVQSLTPVRPLKQQAPEEEGSLAGSERKAEVPPDTAEDGASSRETAQAVPQEERTAGQGPETPPAADPVSERAVPHREQTFQEAAVTPKYTPVGRPQPGSGTQMQNGEILSVGGVLGMLFLAFLPLVGWIMMLIWAFDSQSSLSRKNIAKGLLLFKLILIGIVILLWLLMSFLLWNVLLWGGYGYW